MHQGAANHIRMADTDNASRPAPEKNFVALKDAALILGLQALLLIFRLGQIPLLGPDEPRYSRVAVEMARANELVTPTLLGEPWLEKPPLYYWLAGLLFRIFGETEFAARGPAVLAALLLTAVTGLMGARLFGASCGTFAMIIVATTPLVFAYGRAASMDMLLAALVTGASGLFLLSIRGIAGPAATPGAWVLMGLAVLAKGPIGALIPLGVAVATAVGLRRFELARVVTPLSLGLFLVVAGPWFVAVYLDQGFHFIEVFILNHNVQRFTSTVHNHPGPFYYYLPVLLLGIFPWTGLIAPAVGAASRMGRVSGISIAAWLGVPLLLFSLAGSKLPGYILPCLPPLAIGLAFATRDLRIPERALVRRVAGIIGLIVAAVLLAFTLRAMREGAPWARSAITPAIWLVATTFLASRAFDRARAESLRILTIGAAGFLLLLTLVAPPVLDAMESGRRLFLPANGREVLVVGAWRTAWMAGYFYNDGRVREVDLEAALALVRAEPRLVLAGPSEWNHLKDLEEISVMPLAEGPRGNILARVRNDPKP